MSQRFDAETATTANVYQALQSSAQLPKLDVASLRPQLNLNLDGITAAIRTLWDAVSDQRHLFEQLEKETNRRRLETEVKVNNVQSNLEGLITQESRRRQAEDEKLRAELQKVRDDANSLVQGMRAEMKQVEVNVNDSLDATSNKLRVQMLSLQDQLSVVRTDTAAAMASGNKANEAANALDKKLNYFIDTCGKDVAQLYKLFGVTKEDAANAIARGTEKETLLQTPALAHFGRLCKGMSDRADSMQRDVTNLQLGLGDAMSRIAAVEVEAAKVRQISEKLSAVELDLKTIISTEDAKLLERILDLEKRIVALQQRPQQAPASQPSGVSAMLPNVEPFDDSAIWTVLNDLRQQSQQLRDQVASKASESTVADLAAQLQALFDRLEQLAASVAQRPAGGEPIHVAAPPQTVKSFDAQALLALKDGLTALEGRMSTAENKIEFLHDDKVSKSQLAQAIKDAMAAFEQAINHLYAEMQKLSTLPHEISEKMDATAGRFRCLSCNRDAGPLQEQIRERLSQMQFPPSNVLLGQPSSNTAASGHMGGNRDISPGRPGSSGGPQIRVSSGAVPGQKDGFGGPHLTASRRKLQNYYESLQRLQVTRGGGQAPQTGVLSAASIGVAQVSETGDVANAIGHDGKYYAGVTTTTSTMAGRVRPKSAPMVRAPGTGGAAATATGSGDVAAAVAPAAGV